MTKTFKYISKTAMVLVMTCILLLGNAINVLADEWPSDTYADAGSAIVMEISTGTVLYEKNADAVNFPASITKIMTALLVVENCSMDEKVVFSEDAVYKNEGNTSHIYRDIGEVMTVEETLYGMMLSSANECAWALGEHVTGGSMTEFIDMMNEKAKSLGCTNTHFCNPNGLPDDDHVTTARDMALISAAAYKNEAFRIVAGTGFYTIPITNKHNEPTYCANHHKMLYPYQGDRRYLYDGCVGGKTGYTVAAGNTLVTFAVKDNMPLVCVIMNADSPGHYKDTVRLFDYCFDHFKLLNISDYENNNSMENSDPFAYVEDNEHVVIPKSAEFSDLERTEITEGIPDDLVGIIEYRYGDKLVGEAEVKMNVATSYTFDFHAVNSDGERVTVVEDTKEKDGTTLFSVIPLKLIIGVITVIVAMIVIFIVCVALGLTDRQRLSTMRTRRAERKRYKTIRMSEYGGSKQKKKPRKKDLHF